MSLTSAYRRDLELGRAPQAADDAWLLAGAVVEQAIDAEPDAPLADVIASIRSIVGDEVFAREAEGEWGDRPLTDGESLFVFGLIVERARALASAESLVVTASRSRALTELDRARLLALRARITRHRGDEERALAQYDEVVRIARRLKSDELVARAALGYASAAQRRGNYPEFEKQLRRMVRYGKRAGTRRVLHEGYLGLTIVSVKRSDFNAAIQFAWEMVESSRGDLTEYARDLQSLGQLFLEMGHPDHALKAYARAFAHRIPIDSALAGFGGLSLAAMRLGKRAVLEWAISELESTNVAYAPPYQVAEACLECAEGAFGLGLDVTGKRLIARALALAEQHGYHEISFRAEGLASARQAAASAERATLRGRAAAVVRTVDTWSEQLPAHAQLMTVGGVR